ncbi:MAG: MFS transporter, partial [Desulfomonilaceae bacterium]
MSDQSHQKSTAWTPLNYPIFRALWIAATVSNIGTWMQNVAGVWMMTSLSHSPVMVSLMQTATSLPVFLVVLPAGAIADIIDRRQMLLFTQGWMTVAAAGLALITYMEATT